MITVCVVQRYAATTFRKLFFTEGADSVRLDRGDFGGQITLPLQWPNHCRKARLGVHLIIIIDDQ